jgi:phosphate/sulfate permease
VKEFADWDSFYLIIGGAAGALIGLQFVVLTLIAERGRRVSPEAGRAFSTPTVLHFSVVLFLSAFIRVPWPSITLPSIIGAIVGAGGVVYIITIIREIRAQSVYRPVFEDWLFHVILPLAAYLTLFILAFVALWDVRISLFAGAAATLVLLFTAIHNAWDAVTWHVFEEPEQSHTKRKELV